MREDKLTVALPVLIINFLTNVWFSAISVLHVAPLYLHLEYRLQNYRVENYFRDHLIFYFIHTETIFSHLTIYNSQFL